MPTQEEKLREEFLGTFTTSSGRRIFDWFLARTIPKEEVREMVDRMCQHIPEYTSVGACIGWVDALQDLATRLGVKK